MKNDMMSVMEGTMESDERHDKWDALQACKARNDRARSESVKLQARINDTTFETAEMSIEAAHVMCMVALNEAQISHLETGSRELSDESRQMIASSFIAAIGAYATAAQQLGVMK